MRGSDVCNDKGRELVGHENVTPYIGICKIFVILILARIMSVFRKCFFLKILIKLFHYLNILNLHAKIVIIK